MSGETTAKTIDPQQMFQEIFKMEKYRNAIRQMATQGRKSIPIEFEDINIKDHELAKMLIDKPDEYLNYAAEGAYEQLRIEDNEYAEKTKAEDFTVRVAKLLDVEQLRFLGAEHLSKLVMIEAIVVSATPIRPILMKAAYKCRKCGTTNYITQTEQMINPPVECIAPDCGGKGKIFTFNTEESTFKDSQDLRLQERPEDLPAGQLPRTIAVKLIGKELVELARPGDHVAIVGVPKAFSLEVKGVGKSRTFTMLIDANNIEVLGKEPENNPPSPEEEKKIRALARDPEIHQKIRDSIAPSIYGYEHVKEAIVYLLFSGVSKSLPDINIRGELNVLLIGDPGTAKSQLLQYIPRVAPRGLFTSGRGTTAAGLTASVSRDKNGSMTLEAGALVLADKGVLSIDEFEKMKPEDRVAIHEAMEQHTVSIAKSGVIATLNARTSILAAANPSLGRYEPARTVAENISTLPITILSRFDLIFILRDTPEKNSDARLTTHILGLHQTAGSPVEPIINGGFLRKYIAYAKTFKPKLTGEALRKISDFYLAMRGSGENEGSPIAITARQLESLIRIAEARARAALRDVTVEDAEAAVNITKKSLEQVGIDLSSYKMDIDLIMTGKPKSFRDKINVVIDVYTQIAQSTGNRMILKEELIAKLDTDHKMAPSESERLYRQLMKDGTFFEPREGYVNKT